MHYIASAVKFLPDYNEMFWHLVLLYSILCLEQSREQRQGSEFSQEYLIFIKQYLVSFFADRIFIVQRAILEPTAHIPK